MGLLKGKIKDVDPIIDDLYELRLERNLTQGELAKKANVTQMSISQMERGYNGINLATLRKLADALDMDIVLVKRSKK